VPERDDWFANPAAPPMKNGKRDADQPIFIPKQPLKPHLIERVTITA
jgi:hypothetical protein